MKSDDERALIVFRRIDPASGTDLANRGRQDLHSLQGESDGDEAEHAYAEGMRFHSRHFDGDRLEDDLFASVHWLRIAAEKGHSEAQYRLGHLFHMGGSSETVHGNQYIGEEPYPGSDSDPPDFIYHGRADSFVWMLAAAKQGHAMAQSDVGDMIYKYRNTLMNHPHKFDIEQSLYWWRLAAENGINVAKARIADFYERDEAPDRHLASWRSGIESRPAAGEWSEGRRHVSVWRKDKDIGAALSSFRAAATHGHPLRQDALGCMLYDGEGLPKDDAEAVQWFRKAAEQGLALAQYHLGRAYAEGRGVHQDDLNARLWFIAAAEQGNEAAKNALTRVVRAGTESTVAQK